MSDPADTPEERLRFFKEQQAGTAPIQRTRPKIRADDDGVMAAAIGVDLQKEVVIIQFPKPVTWLGLDLATALAFRNELDKKITQLAAI